MAKRREPTGNAPVELKLDIPEDQQPDVLPPEAEVPAEQMPPRFNPVPMEPGTPEAVLNNLMVREICDPTGPMEPLSPTVNLLARYTLGLMRGTEMTGLMTEVARIVQHQPEKTEVFNALLNQIEQERVADMVEIRAGSEKILKRAVKRGDISSSEAMVLQRMSNCVIQDYLKRTVEGAKDVDTVTVTQKIDYTKHTVEQSIQHKWENIPPQMREVIRKKLFEVKKEMRREIEAVTTVTPVTT